jgi:hypothetical protein
MSRYVRQKFWEAPRARAGDGDIEKRIRFAGDCSMGLQEDQIPVTNLDEFLETLRERLRDGPLSIT